MSRKITLLQMAERGQRARAVRPAADLPPTAFSCSLLAAPGKAADKCSSGSPQLCAVQLQGASSPEAPSLGRRELKHQRAIIQIIEQKGVAGGLQRKVVGDKAVGRVMCSAAWVHL